MVATHINSNVKPVAMVDLDPKSTYEVITREKVEHINDELKEIRYRVNGIFYMVIGSLTMDVLLRWLG